MPCVHIDTSIKRNTDLEFPSDFHDLQQADMITDNPEPVIQGPLETKWYEPDQTLTRESSKKDLLWILSRLHQENPELQQVPGWSGFNQMFDRSSQIPTVIGTLPVIKATAHKFDTLWAVILRCLAMTE